MSLGKPKLVEKIRAEIGSKSISFQRFMQLCLYEPTEGFYVSPPMLGSQGHFYTSVQASHLFGQLLAQQFYEMWKQMECPNPWFLIEQGAHDGSFATDVLKWCRDFRPDFYSALEYCIIEPFPACQNLQKEKLTSAGVQEKCRQMNSWNELQHFNVQGVFFCNELVDAFPVHRITFYQNRWWEIHVVWKENQFSLIRKEISSQNLAQAIQRLSLPPIEGYMTEINLETGEWIQQINTVLQRGFILVVDYGYTEQQYYHPSRTQGTLLAYYQQRKNVEFLKRVGEQDLTAHVNFSSLMEMAQQCDWQLIGFTDQHHFLLGVAQQDLFKMQNTGAVQRPEYAHFMKAFNLLTHPEMMGTQFKFLVHHKGLTRKPKLSGFSVTIPQ